MPRNYIKKKESRRKTYAPNLLQNAISKVKNKEMTSYAASKEYGVPRSTIARHLLGIKCSKVGEGRPNRLSADAEKDLVSLLSAFSDFGFGLDKKQFMKLVQTYIELNGFQKKFVNGVAGDQWFCNFLNRWQKEISIRTPELLTLTRALACNKTVIDAWFLLLKATLEKCDIMNRPAQILNCDESGFCTNPINKKIICKRGIKNPVSIAPGSGKEQFTVLATISAAGRNFPPFILFAGKNLYKEWMTGGPNGSLYGVTKNGWMETEVFTEYFNHLVLWLKDTPKPVLLIFDGHISHISLETVKKAVENHITILCLPAHCSHLLQSLDVGVFRQVKHVWREILANWYTESRLKVVGKSVFPSLLKKLYDTSFKPAHLVQSFAKTGIFPFDPSAIASDKLNPSEIYEHPFSQKTNNYNNNVPQNIVLDTNVNDQNDTCENFSIESTNKYNSQKTIISVGKDLNNEKINQLSISNVDCSTGNKIIREIVKEQLMATKGDGRSYNKRPTKKIKRHYGGECLTSEDAFKRLNDEENECFKRKIKQQGKIQNKKTNLLEITNTKELKMK
ncbi:uncharacterized protein LOC124816132 [Hydra vulgaris]|uniref:uncharacterized protein LOC124816132 n=1 Tax=Hydra vulgaris TaxID=6087 RepID=UPI0032E9E80C